MKKVSVIMSVFVIGMLGLWVVWPSEPLALGHGLGVKQTVDRCPTTRFLV